MEENFAIKKFKDFAGMIASRLAINTKDILTSNEAAAYLGISKSCLYKLTMDKEIPYSKPNGKMCYFERKALDRWALQNRCATVAEISDRAHEYCQKGGNL
ncbi:MAG: helix-turn-helix domain-containing protein [Prevotella sp.]|jgi:excisionase family DNA binding protein|uniref:Helix-turn-helix domain-containing protein n=1 Tax=Segatella cerevisiae TaxID=2053716 RepID=A0ABT1BZ37_9BACT|nr:helix-turn-helix domain-containing protein [Segatella cerevisiae]MCH3994921.1 helix-turn-helix domain-containing protein [Prevotella sp.]MCI1246176.1 helix-turn-helix domain-containing protein [Prevotella sp.]MCO6026346.1 helix-turn-helix domain-containing protein [Segatella cerevisiae]